MAIVAQSLVVIVVSNRLVAVSRRSVVMHCWSGLVHVTLSIEAIVLVAVSTLVGNEYLGVCVEETASVIIFQRSRVAKVRKIEPVFDAKALIFCLSINFIS